VQEWLAKGLPQARPKIFLAAYKARIRCGPLVNEYAPKTKIGIYRSIVPYDVYRVILSWRCILLKISLDVVGAEPVQAIIKARKPSDWRRDFDDIIFRQN